MPRILICSIACIVIAAAPVSAQEKAASTSSPAPLIVPGYAASFPPVKNPATEDQIREYLRISGEADRYRTRLIANVDRLRSVGEPYWPESFWTSIKDEIRKADLTPMYIVIFQHGVSSELMEEVLASNRRLGKFSALSPACIKLGGVEDTMQKDTEQIMQTETQGIIERVYQIYKPQIKAARARYIAEHPDWKDN